MGDTFDVKVQDLQKGSEQKVAVICDFGGELFYKAYRDYNAQKDGGDCCKNCQGKKSLKTCIERHGEGARGRILKQFAIDNYGVDNIAKVKETTEKIKETNIQRYGVPSPLMLKDSKEKAIVNSWTEEAKEKRINTNLKKYGHEYGLQNKEVREKIAQTYEKHGTIKTSAQQLAVYDMLSQKYESCFLNYRESRCFLDCLIIVDDIKIDIEYDGKHWHQDEQKDRKRDEFLKSLGYKIIRIKGSHENPTLEQIEEKINYLITTDVKYTYIELQN